MGILCLLMSSCSVSHRDSISQEESSSNSTVVYADKYGNPIIVHKEDSILPEMYSKSRNVNYENFEKDFRDKLLNRDMYGTKVIREDVAMILRGKFLSTNQYYSVFVYKTSDNMLNVELYKMIDKEFILLQKEENLKTQYEVDVRFQDCNGDNVKDILIYAGHAARPSNYFQHLLIADTINERFVRIPVFSDLPQTHYDNRDNSIIVIYKHGTYSLEKYRWSTNNTLVIVGGEECWGDGRYLFREKFVFDNLGNKKSISIDSILVEKAFDGGCYGCGPEAWDETFSD